MASEIQTRVLRKITWRIVPFIMLLYFVAFIDRVNIGFASLTMNKDIGLSPTVYGFGAGIFFWGYFLFEVPSNIILHKVGARIWIARVMVTWGIVSAAMAFVQGPTSFYVLRFLLGVAEAGFFPGIILYSLLLVSGAPACRGDRAVHGGGAALDRAGLASLRCAPGDGRNARLQGLAMAVRAGSVSGRAARLRRAGIPHRPPGESQMARG
ncbi:MFS family permease [Bradyrhizobium sp. LM2.9]